jgi:peptidase M1-like protein
MNRVLRTVLVLLCGATIARGQGSDGGSAWNILAAPAMDPAKYAVTQNVEIVRDRVHIKLASGNIQFAKPVNGVVFAAVFHGEGHVLIEPPNPTESQQFKLFTRQEKLAAAFSDATFTFSDELMEEVGKQVKWKDGPGGDDFYAKRQQEREDIGGQYLPRIYKSVMSPDRKRTAYFLADMKTKEAGWIQVQYDAMQPEEIRAGRWVDVGPFKLKDNWTIFPAGGRDPRHAYDDPAERQDFLLPSYKISAFVTDGAELGATSNVTVSPRYTGERVLLFALDSNLRVSSVKDEKGKELEYHQARERKENSQTYGDYVAVVLNDPTQAGHSQLLTFVYQGKHVVYRVGNGNYFCQSFGWYPSAFASELGVDDFAFRSDFELNFRSPKKYTLVATGRKAGETTDGKEIVTTWKSEIPLAAAGFAFGDYKVVTDKVGDVEIQVYANNQPDELLTSIQRRFENPLNDLAAGPGASHIMSSTAAVGNLTPSALGKTINIEAGNTLRVFQGYFGPYPYKQLAITNIIGSYGQGWPGLLYLGWFTFLDSTQRNALGIHNQTGMTDFFRGHESSHQWWGHRVGWKSYHDQWLSEGFAEFSGLLYVQYRENMKESLNQWRLDKQHLTEPDLNSHKTETLGPIWMGQRIQSSVTNRSSYQNLIYSKGGYVLQMIRMQMMDSRSADPEHIFKETMQDYCKTFDNKSASTEDFKAIVEKHMTRSMDLDGNHKMDWFFNQYVYGTERPQYTFHATVTPEADGKTSISATLQRTGVPGNWKDVVPMYAHIGDRVVRLGTIQATHDTETLNVVIPQKIDKLTIDDFEDMIAEVKQ